MPRELKVRTPENVEIVHSLAGIGSRFAALTLDHLLQGLILFLFALIVISFIGGVNNWLDTLDQMANLSSWAVGAFFVVLFLVMWGYFIFFEVIWNGQTPGKRALNIRVVKENGTPLDFFSAAIRNIVRVIDYLPATYAVGLVTMFFSPAYKRLGDYAAGTVVVKEYKSENAKGRMPNEEAQPSLASAEQGMVPTGETSAFGIEPSEFEEIPGVTIAGIRRVTREEYEAVRRYLSRREELPANMAETFARRIAEPILQRLDMAPEEPEQYPYELFLETLARDYLKWQDVRY